MGSPHPHELYEQTGGGIPYRLAMLEHGYVVPSSPESRRRNALLKQPGKRAEPCGLTHETEWSEWRDYEDEFGPYQGRWCVVCCRADSRQMPGGTDG